MIAMLKGAGYRWLKRRRLEAQARKEQQKAGQQFPAYMPLWQLNIEAARQASIVAVQHAQKLRPPEPPASLKGTVREALRNA